MPSAQVAGDFVGIDEEGVVDALAVGDLDSRLAVVDDDLREDLAACVRAVQWIAVEDVIFQLRLPSPSGSASSPNGSLRGPGWRVRGQ